MQEISQNEDFILKVDSCLTPLECIHNASILCRGEFIQALGGYSALRVLEDIPCVDMSGCRAVPGLVDTHIHGSGGFAAMDAEPHSNLSRMSEILARHGVTSYILTVLSSTTEKMLEVISAISTLHEKEFAGARPVGIHIEGPFLNPAKRGAQSEGTIRPIDMVEADELIAAGKGRIRMMTLAPELEKSCELIELLQSKGILPSMGHSMADETSVLRAISAGASRCTHLFNGMPPLDQRKSGLTSIGLTDDRLTIELIVDGVHVHPTMIDLACRSKPDSGVVGISDATQGAGLQDGIYHFGREKVRIRGNACRRVSDGRLAGSCLTLDAAWRNIREFSALSDLKALACFTSNAAKSIGLDNRGILRPGTRADIAVVDETGNVVMTIVGGRIAYDSRKEATAPHSS